MQVLRKQKINAFYVYSITTSYLYCAMKFNLYAMKYTLIGGKVLQKRTTHFARQMMIKTIF